MFFPSVVVMRRETLELTWSFGIGGGLVTPADPVCICFDDELSPRFSHPAYGPPLSLGYLSPTFLKLSACFLEFFCAGRFVTCLSTVL